MPRDHYAHLTDRIIARMEAGDIPWHRPWDRTATGAARSVHGHFYRGFNALMLGTAGYSDPRWITFKQAKQRGGSVRKGERGTPVTIWKWFQETDRETGQETGKRIPWLRTYTVFNIEQTDGVELPDIPAPTDHAWDPVAQAERIVADWFDGPTIQHSDIDGRAYYAPTLDLVNMPTRERFHSAAGYYGTLFHELTHATGHAKRLDRLERCGFGSSSYAKEELVAEIGSAFLRAECGLVADDRDLDNSAAYLRNWIAALRNDKKLIVQAAQLAQKAADMITRADVETAQDEKAHASAA